MDKIQQSPQRSHRRQVHFWLGVLVILMLIAIIKHHIISVRNHQPPPGLPVVAATTSSSNVPVYLSALGSVTPTYTVTVKTQINGQLLRVLFKEGQMVKTGDLLAEIDPRPYEATLIQYQGQLTRDEALLANAELDLKRYQNLWRVDSVAKQTLDTQKSVVQQDEGTVKIDQGLIDSTKVNLIYTRITSPINGRVGLRLVDPGNFVQTSDTTGIAVINMLNPITVIFTIPEDNVPQVLRQINTGKTLPVYAYDRLQNKLLDKGQLLTIDNQIDPTTGTVKLKAVFQNKNNLLFPNQFVNIQLLVDTLVNAIIVPTAAIQRGEQGTFVYLINADQTVSVHPVTTGVTEGNNTVVSKGLTLHQSVVIEGADKLTDGAKVSLVNVNDPAPPSKRSTA